MAAKKPPAKKAPTKSQAKKAELTASRTQAEHDYGTGARIAPPQLHEMSPQSQAAVRAGFTASMSNLKTRETKMAQPYVDPKDGKTKTRKSALPPETIARLTDKHVDIPTAAGHMASSWDRMMDSPDRPDPSWYFGHNRRLGAVAEKHGADPDKVMTASAAMSPQNGPDNEYRAVAAMTDAVQNKRMVRDKRTGKSKRLTSMSPSEMSETTGVDNAKNVEHAPDFDLEGFRSGGTNREGGWRTLAESGYNDVAKMQSAKVPLYDQAIRDSKPDTPLHHEYEARFGDQDAARKVRMAKEDDIRAGRTGSETLRGVPDRVDLYGLMGKNAPSSDPIHDHPILGERGIAVPDTWVAGILSGQDLRDHHDTASPAKLVGSQTKTTSSNVPGNTFAPPGEVDGGKKFTGNAAWGMAAVEAIQGAAVKAREPGSQTNIPPVMMQEMTWTHERAEVAKSTRVAAAHPESTRAPHMVGNRVAKLTSGGLQGEKEFRPQTGSRVPQSLERPGTFHRGNDNPLDTDSVTVVAGRRGAPVTGGRNPALDHFHAAASGPAVNELDKRRAIHGALTAHHAERAQRGITARPDGGMR